MLVYAIIDVRSSTTRPLGDAVETFVRREDAKRFIEEVRGDDPDLASYLDRGAGPRGGRDELGEPRCDRLRKARSRDMHCPVRGIPCDGRAGTRS